MKSTYNFEVRSVDQRKGDKPGSVLDRVRLDRTDESKEVELAVSLVAPNPSGYRPGQIVKITIEV